LLQKERAAIRKFGFFPTVTHLFWETHSHPHLSRTIWR